MRQHHRAGEKLFVDWAGDTLPYVDEQTGEVREAHLFIAVLGFSNYTFARAYENERTESFLDAHACAFAHFGGVPELVVPDNLKTGVKQPDRYEAEIAAPYAELAAHYGLRGQCRPGSEGPATRPRSRSACRSPSARSWRRCESAPSSASPKRTPRSRSGSVP